MYSKPGSPQGIGQVLDGSFRLMGAGWKSIWALALVAALVANAGTIYQLFTLDPTGAAANPSPGPYMALIVGGLIVSIVFYGAITLRLGRIANGEPQGGEIGVALTRLPALVGLAICVSLVVAAAAIPLFVYVWSMWPNIGVLEVSIACILTAPIWLFAISLCFSQIILLLERQGPIQSLSSSHRLVWGKWWRTATLLTIGGVIIIVAYMLAAILGGVGGAVIASGENVLAAAIAMVVVIAAVSLFVGPYSVALLMAIYWDLKLRKEGGDLAARAEAV
jgi:hypothetical protein